MGIGSGGQWLPLDFKHGTNIINRRLKVLLLAFFAIFRSFFRCPPFLEEAK